MSELRRCTNCGIHIRTMGSECATCNTRKVIHSWDSILWESLLRVESIYTENGRMRAKVMNICKSSFLFNTMLNNFIKVVLSCNFEQLPNIPRVFRKLENYTHDLGKGSLKSLRSQTIAAIANGTTANQHVKEATAKKLGKLFHYTETGIETVVRTQKHHNIFSSASCQWFIR